MYKPVLVTGASSGIGEASVVHLARKGFRVFAAARRIDRLKALEGFGEGAVTAIALDITDEVSIEAALADINAAGGPLYGLVNSAGVSVTGPLEDVPVNEWRRQFETNLFGLVALTQRVLPDMRAAGAGRIVNIGSVAGRIAAPFMAPYVASKHALEGMSDALRREVDAFGIHVSVIRPGFINTEFGEQEQDGLTRFAREGGPYTAALDVFRAWHAKGHPKGASPMEVAEAVHHALVADRPHSRYTVPKRYIPSLMMRNLAPSAVTDRVFARVTGIATTNGTRTKGNS